MGIQDFTKAGKLNKLILIYNNQELIIPSNFGTFTIGRNTGVSSLFIKSEFASRDHCQIIYRRGKFILCDTSTNGTYVTQHKQKEIYLRREELPLTIEGLIVIGQSSKQAGDDIIKYQLDT
ncbi:MAG: FHA domain-containing protein [Gammaproteobacteria bacterium]|jgi:adenylate cyclase|nr:FHA domain-containing protein [Gammaproteobacteria bacterium]